MSEERTQMPVARGCKSARLLAICIGAAKRQPLGLVEEAEAVAGHGLRGDRFFRQAGCGKPDQEVTLIESETIAAVAREFGIALEPTAARRNLVTEGVALNDLVGKEFRVGQVRLTGIRLCHPCDHLEALTHAGVKAALCQRGGLRAQILTGGTLRPGDAIEIG